MDLTQAFIDMRDVANKAQAENAQLRAEVASLRLTLGGRTFSADIPELIGCPMPGACAQVAEIGRLRNALAEMQDDLDAAHRLLGLAPYPLTA